MAKNEKKDHPKLYEKEFDYLTNSATGMDCTGLMYRPADNEEEAESYRQVYDYLPPAVKVSPKGKG